MLIHYDPSCVLYVLGIGIPAQAVAHRIRAEYNNTVHLVPDTEFITIPKNSYCVLGFSNPVYRKRWLNELNLNDYHWATYIHPTAVVDDLSGIGRGCYIDALACISWGVVCGEFTKVCETATVGHGTTLGRNVFVGPGSNIGGSSQIGNNVYLGIQSMVRDKISIVDDCFFAMGTVVRKSVTKSARYFNANYTTLHEFE